MDQGDLLLKILIASQIKTGPQDPSEEDTEFVEIQVTHGITGERRCVPLEIPSGKPLWEQRRLLSRLVVMLALTWFAEKKVKRSDLTLGYLDGEGRFVTLRASFDLEPAVKHGGCEPLRLVVYTKPDQVPRWKWIGDMTPKDAIYAVNNLRTADQPTRICEARASPPEGKVGVEIFVSPPAKE